MINSCKPENDLSTPEIDLSMLQIGLFAHKIAPSGAAGCHRKRII